MSPRGFKLGLALFLIMSGLFSAKLIMLGGGSVRSGWAVSTEPQSSPSAAPNPAPSISPQPAPTANPETEAIKATEAAVHTAPPVDEGDATLVEAIKRELTARGYRDARSSTGLDLQDRAAIMAFEADHKLRLTGEATQDLLHRILFGTGGDANAASAPPTVRAEEVIKSVQAQLKHTGQPDLAIDGQINSATSNAIRAYERTHGLKESGRISGDLVAKLNGVARSGPGAP